MPRHRPKIGTPLATTGLGHGQRHLIAFPIVGFVVAMRFDIEKGRMNVGARAGEQDSVNGIDQRSDIGDVGCSGEHQGQGAGNFRHGQEILLPRHLGHVVITNEIPGADDADAGFRHHGYWFLPVAPADEGFV